MPAGGPAGANARPMLNGPRLLILAALLGAASGCHLVLPEVAHQPIVHNPFPQFSRVAVVPFFNQSDEATVDGRQFAMAYFAELQSVPGFEVVPVGVAEAKLRQLALEMTLPNDPVEQARLLGRALDVDVVVVGSVTDFDPFYPPRCGLRVEWYATNPGYHAIPAGYGLPWGTPQEEFIPDRLVFEAEMELARAQMATQEPIIGAAPDGAGLQPLRGPAPLQATPRGSDNESLFDDRVEEIPPPPRGAAPAAPAPDSQGEGSGDGTLVNPLRPAGFEAPIDETGRTTGPNAPADTLGMTANLPPDWPDARGFTPPGPAPARPLAEANPGPVMTHTRMFRSTDPDFTSALSSYVDFRDDARIGGWQSYLTRSEDFIRFCCHLHVVEMLSARGGGDETRVVHRWSEGR